MRTIAKQGSFRKASLHKIPFLSGGYAPLSRIQPLHLLFLDRIDDKFIVAQSERNVNGWILHLNLFISLLSIPGTDA